MACRKNFTVRVLDPWYWLPESLVSAPTLNFFKTSLDRAWSHYSYMDSSEWFQTLSAQPPPHTHTHSVKTLDKEDSSNN